MLRHACALLACTVAACNEHAPRSTTYDWSHTIETTRCWRDPAKVDVLLVIDDSASMAQESTTLADNLARFIGVYDHPTSRLDWRIAVTTTDATHPWCTSTSEDGALLTSSCRERLADFVATESHESAAADVTTACTDVCGLDRLPIVPTHDDRDGALRKRPWIERHRGRHNLPADVSIAEALQCLGQVGVAGCTFESPLEAARLAVRRSFDPADPAYGFVRDDASLFVLFITDEADCSMPANNAGLVAPPGTSAACWDAAVDCIGASPGPYEDCPAVLDGPLHPIDRYVDLLADIEREKQERDPNLRVFTHVLGGVPEGYENGNAEVVIQDSLDPSFQAAFGIGPVCQTVNATAIPLARMREVTAAFPEPGRPTTMYSLCADQWTSALACVPHSVEVRPVCVEGCVADADPDTPETLEPQCVVTRRTTSDARPHAIPECIDGAFPPGETSCLEWITADELDPSCSDAGFNLQLITYSDDPLLEGSCLEITCSASDDPARDCPNLP